MTPNGESQMGTNKCHRYSTFGNEITHLGQHKVSGIEEFHRGTWKQAGRYLPEGGRRRRREMRGRERMRGEEGLWLVEAGALDGIVEVRVYPDSLHAIGRGLQNHSRLLRTGDEHAFG